MRGFPANTLGEYKFVVILSHMDGKYLLSRHRARTTWETQGGHIEPGETPLEAAKRELWENPARWNTRSSRCATTGPGTASAVPRALCSGRRSQSLARCRRARSGKPACLKPFPENLTYPHIAPALFAYEAEQRGRERRAACRIQAAGRFLISQKHFSSNSITAPV